MTAHYADSAPQVGVVAWCWTGKPDTVPDTPFESPAFVWGDEVLVVTQSAGQESMRSEPVCLDVQRHHRITLDPLGRLEAMPARRLAKPSSLLQSLPDGSLVWMPEEGPIGSTASEGSSRRWEAHRGGPSSRRRRRAPTRAS